MCEVVLLCNLFKMARVLPICSTREYAPLRLTTLWKAHGCGDAAAEMKRISVSAWHQLHEAHRGGPELSNDDCCVLCARETLALVAAHSSEEVRSRRCCQLRVWVCSGCAGAGLHVFLSLFAAVSSAEACGCCRRLARCCCHPPSCGALLVGARWHSAMVVRCRCYVC